MKVTSGIELNNVRKRTVYIINAEIEGVNYLAGACETEEELKKRIVEVKNKNFDDGVKLEKLHVDTIDVPENLPIYFYGAIDWYYNKIIIGPEGREMKEIC